MFAPAKINLSLYVTGKREDGYHTLESLVTFADIGDVLTYEPANEFALTITGEIIEGDNLVLKAARLFKEAYPQTPFLHFHLQKNLPIASGLGGGSSDAAAALRILKNLTGFDDIMPIAKQLGADVPVCLNPKTRNMFGIGHELGEEIKIIPIPALLVNPRIHVPTSEIFKRLTSYSTPSNTYHNDLQKPAIEFAPIIGVIIDELSALNGVTYAAMSGSGATCFALFDTIDQRDAAYEPYAKLHNSYWLKPTMLGLDYSPTHPICT